MCAVSRVRTHPPSGCSPTPLPPSRPAAMIRSASIAELLLDRKLHKALVKAVLEWSGNPAVAGRARTADGYRPHVACADGATPRRVGEPRGAQFSIPK
ncbi:hypothetical protein ACIA8H_18605 [Streptomyces goshikiensis]|uniref:hypothetical protein n=1 Tax=Streptomyces goshikiensis TaxID=1942 RepID=UPI0037A23AFE